MKKLLKFPILLLALLVSAATLTGCVATTQPAVVVGPPPGPYYGYPPPRPYYRSYYGPGYRRYYRPRPARVIVAPRRPVVVSPPPRPYYNGHPGRGRVR